MKCPMRISYWGETTESNCHPDCAWRMSWMKDGKTSDVCAFAVIAANAYVLCKPVNVIEDGE